MGVVKIKKRLIVFIFLIFSFGIIYAGGNKESSEKKTQLAEIDKLIKATDYNSALLLIEEFIQEYPDDFDTAQKRVRKILKVRNEYNSLAENLIDVIVNEPTNDKKKLDMIAKLESMELNPSSSNVKFIKQTKAAAQFTYFRAMFDQYMADGTALVQAKKYTEAVDTFTNGFDLYQESFYEQSYGEEIEQPVTEALNDILSSVALYKRMQSILLSSAEIFRAALESGQCDEASDAFEQFRQNMQDFADARNTVATSGWLFESQFKDLQITYPDLTEASFLAFAYRFALGRSNAPDSGILGAMDRQWESVIESLKPVALEAIDKKTIGFTDSLALELTQNITDTNTGTNNGTSLSQLFLYPSLHENERTALDETIKMASIAQSVNSLYALRLSTTDVYAEDPYPAFNTGVEYIQTLALQTKEVLDTSASLATLINEYSSFTPTVTATEEVRDNETTYSTAMQSYVSRFLEIASLAGEQTALNVSTYQSVYNAPVTSVDDTVESVDDTTVNIDNATSPETLSFETEGINYPIAREAIHDWNEVFEITTDVGKKVTDTASVFAATTWNTLALFLADGCTSIASEYTANYNEAVSLYHGDKDASLGAYPAECIAALELFGATIDTDKRKFDSRYALLDNVPQVEVAPLNLTQFTRSKQQIASAIAEMNRIKEDSADLMSNARQQVTLAQRAKNEAVLRYNQAVTYLKQNEFQSARDTIQRSRVKYNESLAIQEDPNLRVQSDTMLTQLGIDINKAENELVVREVRQFKTQAKNAYYIGNFEQAENLLVQARTRWNTTNIEDDQEIINLLTLVGTALSMKTGRVIPATAPLYPEMSQILSIANQYFDQGKQLMDNGKKTEAIEILNTAKQKLRELQLVYPLNQEASLLTLQIDQLIDPVSFKSMFDQKYAAAKTDYKVASKQQTAYTDLLDLYSINPSYPGLKDFIYTVEIEIGVRQKPVDRSGITKSNQLTREAQSIVDSNSRDEIALNQALAKVDEAIKLNPDNETAMILKDRIQTSIGGQAVSVLSSESEALYQRAVQELQKGNTIEASALVAQLLTNKQNQRSSKILDLKKRVESLL